MFREFMLLIVIMILIFPESGASHKDHEHDHDQEHEYKKKRREHSRCSRRFRIIRRCLEREVDAGAGHSEIVIGTRDDVPAYVVGPTDVRGEANFKSTADLTDCARTAVRKLSPDDAKRLRRIEEEVVTAAATEDAAAAEPEIWREARAANREAEREGTEGTANGV
jgi:hypothetical protein